MEGEERERKNLEFAQMDVLNVDIFLSQKRETGLLNEYFTWYLLQSFKSGTKSFLTQSFSRNKVILPNFIVKIWSFSGGEKQ